MSTHSPLAGPALIVQAGAWTVFPDESDAPYRDGCRQVAVAGWDVLRGGGTARDAVRTAVLLLEDDRLLGTGGAAALDGSGGLAADAARHQSDPGAPVGEGVPALGTACDHFAAEGAGAAVATGSGEATESSGLAQRAVDLAREHLAQDACYLALRELEVRMLGRGGAGAAGVILVRRDGSLGYAFNMGAMAVAYMDGELAEPVVGGLSRGGSR